MSDAATPVEPPPGPSPQRRSPKIAHVRRLWARILTAGDLGRFLAEIRVERDLTQAELALELGISRPYLSSLESGRSTIYSERLFALLNFLRVELTAEADVHDVEMHLDPRPATRREGQGP
jgi:HTH-type transcriptional regulator/antitoxin HipB